MAVAVAPTLQSAEGLLSLLEEDEQALQVHALKSLVGVVESHWAEVVAGVSTIEALYEDDSLPASTRELAALLASKVFYNLGEQNEALSYALGAGALFDIEDASDYTQTLLAKAVDEYSEKRQAAAGDEEAEAAIDPRLTAVVERLFERCFGGGHYQQAIGVALESRRVDMLEETVARAPDAAAALAYATETAQAHITHRDFRATVLRTLVRLYQGDSSVEPDYLNVCQCLCFLEDAPSVSTILDKLIRGSDDEALLAYQVAFDLYENEIPQFMLQVREGVMALGPKPKPEAAPAPEAEGGDDAMETDAAAAAAAAEPSLAADVAAAPGLVVALTGRDRPNVLAEVHRMICDAGGEIKEARSSRIGGTYSSLLLVRNTNRMALEQALEHHDGAFWITNASEDLQGPLCVTSPATANVRKVEMQVRFVPGVVASLSEKLCKLGVRTRELNEYRAGPFVVVDAVLDLPDGLNEFAKLDDNKLRDELAPMGVQLLSSSGVGVTAKFA